MSRQSQWLSLVVLVVGTGGCVRPTLMGEAVQPNPLAMEPGEGSYESKPIHIRVRDMDVPRTFKMYNSAWFSVVSRDRLRFHVSVVHKWEEWADVSTWNVHLEDDRGRVFYPEAKEKRANKFTTKTWDYERRTAIKNSFGDVIGTHNDGYRRRVPLDHVDLFKGDGDYVFHAKDIIDPELKRLTLVMSRGGVSYRFTWVLFDPRRDPEMKEKGSKVEESTFEASPWAF